MRRLVESCPATVRPYLQLMRVDRPIGSWLLFWPCGWGLAQAQPPGLLPDPQLLAIYAAGSWLMRGAGCTINDLWDRDIDKQVERTCSRPLAVGSVRPLDALVLLSAQLSAGAALLLQLNWSSIQLGCCSLLPVLLYPLAKRVTNWPQAVLGLTFNWGALMAFASVHGHVVWQQALPLYVAGVCWTIVYDTIYAHQDKDDDLVLGIKSTALKFGDSTVKWLAGFSGCMCSALLLAGWAANQTWPYYLGVTLSSAHIWRQVLTLDTRDATGCGNKFRSNRWLGLILFSSIIAGKLAANTGDSDAETGSTNPDTDTGVLTSI